MTICGFIPILALSSIILYSRKRIYWLPSIFLLFFTLWFSLPFTGEQSDVFIEKTIMSIFLLSIIVLGRIPIQHYKKMGRKIMDTKNEISVEQGSSVEGKHED